MRSGRIGTWAAIAIACAACGDEGSSSTSHGGAGGSGGASSGGAAGDGGTTTSGTGGNTGGTSAGGGGSAPIDLCAGLVQDKASHPVTPLAKPALGQAVTDPELGTTIRRITAVMPPGGGNDPVVKPMYSTISAWNADESRLILFSVAEGTHVLYDGKTYERIGPLDISPADIEQVYWHTKDPDILFYVDYQDFVRYHVSTEQKEVLTTFDFCSGAASAGSDPLFTSWDSKRIGLGCGSEVFLYDIASNQVIAKQTIAENPAQATPSGKLAYLSDSGRVTNEALVPLRTLDLVEPWGHASLSMVNGHDTWNGVVYDPGPNGNDDIGALVTWDLEDGTSKVVIGPKTGWPYPPTVHLSGMAYKQPGWVFVSTIGETSEPGILDNENLIADTATGKVCRIGRHRSTGKDNTHLQEPYWAEPHTVPSPSGTRALFGSDWDGGDTVDTYVIELPSYVP